MAGEPPRSVHWPDERNDTRRRRGAPYLEAAIAPAELAAKWGVRVQTIYRDIRKGALRAYRLPGGDLRIRIRDARRYGKPVE
jgi:excisionase family DNA binding protein